MPPGQRVHKRLQAQRLGATLVRLENFQNNTCALLDISVGGLRLLFENALPQAALHAGDILKGEIESSDVPFRLHFTGRVVWLNRAALLGEPATMVGLAFDSRPEFPENLLRLVEEFGQS